MNKHLKLAACLFITCASSSALAAPELYLGGQAGYQSLEINLTERNYYSDYNSKAVDDYDISGVAGSVFGGVKFFIGNGYYLSLEANIGKGGADAIDAYSDSDGDSWKNELEADKSYGFGLLAGLEVIPGTSIYGRLGYQKIRYEMSYESHGDYFGSLSGSEEADFSGVRYGIGMESEIFHRFALRLDWSQTNYASESFILDGSRMTFDPTENLFQLGAIFKL